MDDLSGKSFRTVFELTITAFVGRRRARASYRKSDFRYCPDLSVCRHPSKAPCSKDPQIILRQICDVIMAVVPGIPNRRAPTMDQRISGWTCSRSQNMPHRNSTPLFRKERPDPLPTDFRQLHMKPLHLSAGKVFLDVQIKSDQREDDDWFCSFICI
jgi:hypothetical protein